MIWSPPVIPGQETGDMIVEAQLPLIFEQQQCHGGELLELDAIW